MFLGDFSGKLSQILEKLGGQNIKNYLIFGIFELKFQGK